MCGREELLARASDGCVRVCDPISVRDPIPPASVLIKQSNTGAYSTAGSPHTTSHCAVEDSRNPTRPARMDVHCVQTR